MIPINQVFLNNDPLLNMSNKNMSYEDQLRLLDSYKNTLEQAIHKKPTTPIWNNIDNEINALNDYQKQELFNNQEYVEQYNKLQELVNASLLELVKNKIEDSPEGREILNTQYNLIIRLKKELLEKENKDMELFKRFKEYSLTHPNSTYEDFLKLQNL